MASLNKDYKYSFITLKSKKEQKLKEFLKKHMGKTQYLNLIRGGKLTINGEFIEDYNLDIKEGDVIELRFKRPQLKEKVELVDFSNLDIIYEDDHILIINKNANTLAIDSVNNRNFEIVSKQVASYLASKKIFEPIHILTRLDADTTGAMLFAKDSFTHAKLSKQQENGLINKEYKCLSIGDNLQPSIINAPIGRKEDSILERKIDLENGKSARTEILNVEQLTNDIKLSTIKLHTGRTHQIRVHLKHVGNEIIGDTLYGTNNLDKRQLLHCSMIEFYDIETNELVSVKAPLKEDMESFINNLK